MGFFLVCSSRSRAFEALRVACGKLFMSMAKTATQHRAKREAPSPDMNKCQRVDALVGIFLGAERRIFFVCCDCWVGWYVHGAKEVSQRSDDECK